MESQIITKEVLELLTINESEKLVADIVDNNLQHLSFIRIRFVIVRFEKTKDWGPKEVLYTNEGFTIEQGMKWKWYFRLLTAKKQIETPKRLVQLQIRTYVSLDKNKILYKVLKNKLIAAKGDLTKALNAIKKIEESNTLFPTETDNYGTLIKYRDNKTTLIKQIEKELDDLKTN